MKYVGMVFAAAILLAAGLGAAGVRIALGQQGPDHRVTICHKVQGNGNTGNGYDIITVDKDSIVNKDGQIIPNGHGTHGEDAIPAFPAGSSGQHEWGAFAGQGNPAIVDNNCAEVVTTTTTTTEPPTTTTTTEPPTTTTTTTETTTQPPTTTEPPPTTTETTTTTTTSPPETQPPPTTETTTTSPPEPTPRTQKPPKMKPPPPNAPPGAPPICPPGAATSARCGPQGNG